MAATRGYANVAKLLLKRGASLSSKTGHSWTSLHRSVAQGFAEFVEILLQHGHPLEVLEEDYWVPLHLGCQNARLVCFAFASMPNRSIGPFGLY